MAPYDDRNPHPRAPQSSPPSGRSPSGGRAPNNGSARPSRGQTPPRGVSRNTPARSGSGRGPSRPPSGSGSGGDKSPKQRPYTGCLSGLIYFMFVIGVSALLAGFIWISANEALGLSKEDSIVTVTVTEEQSMSDITNMLKDAGVINYKWLFNFYASLSSAREKIKPGTYELHTNYDYMAIVNALRPSAGRQASVQVVIPEGFTMRQIFDRLVENKVCSMEELLETAANYDFSYDFLKDLPHDEKRLEGYLFPDTYEFYVGDSAVNVLNKMLYAFNMIWTPDMADRAAELGYSMHEIVTIASMIERETAGASESSLIASVIHNRLESSNFPFLQIDATVQYCLPEHKERLTTEDTKIDNPYNTYMYEGLPPGPIACPGEASIGAALYPEETGYYYYAINKDGVHQFTKTKSEHDAVVEAARAAGR